MPEQSFTVDEPYQGERLDVFLTQHLSARLSRTAVKHLITQDKVSVNGRHVKANYKIHTRDHIVIALEDVEPGSVALAPEDIPLDIIYEDDDLIVLNKAVGMLVHPVHGQNSGTLVNALLHHCDRLSTANDDGRPGIVHRLDRETSGIMIAVKNNQVHENLAKQFKRHKVKKEYVAIVKGIIECDEGVVDVPIVRHATHFDKKAVAREGETGRKAKTFYRVVKRLGTVATIVALFPKTGRTHQLRVHMRHLGHPILGDGKYGDVKSFPRLALHAKSIRFYHPGIHDFVELSAPLPPEFKKDNGDF